jgi:large subunit ribosomal protein L1
MATRGKKYQEAVKQIDQTKAYALPEAVELTKKTCYAKFDETVELHFRMNLDQRAADQQIRGIALLPHGLGKKVRVLVFAQGEAVKIAEEAGADTVGGDDLIKRIEEGWLEIGKLGKILGRKGLMPNPKLGTVVAPGDLTRVIKDSRKGRSEFRLDRTGNVHMPVGKASFEAKQLEENLSAAIEAVVKAKPSGSKGQYIKSATVNTSMGPGIALDLRAIGAAA